MGFVVIIFTFPILNILFYISLSLIYKYVFCLVKNNHNQKLIIISLNKVKVYFFSFLVIFILFMSYFFGYKLNSFLHISDLSLSYLVNILLIWIINIFIFYIFLTLFSEINSKKIYFNILCIFYPFFPLIIFIILGYFSNDDKLFLLEFPFGIEDIFYQFESGSSNQKVGKFDLAVYIFFFFFNIFIWITGRFVFKEKNNKPFKLMITCLLFIILLPLSKIVYEKLNSKEYTTRSKKEYVNSLKEHDLNWHDRVYYDSKYIKKFNQYSELKNLNETERKYILKKSILEEKKVKISDEVLKKKNYFLDIANYYFNFSIVCILLIILFLLYLWLLHDKLADKLTNKLSYWQKRKVKKLG